MPLEDYLEVIFHLCRESGVARVKDIAGRMGVSNPSVVRALRELKRRRLVDQQPYGLVRLTDHGKRLGSAIVARHETLADFLKSVLGLDPAAAEEDACRLEHAASHETILRLRAATTFLRSEAHADDAWIKRLKRHCAKAARERAVRP
jgi:DtxR family transcriptional regulator, Mn-dependent transcriptional regulator